MREQNIRGGLIEKMIDQSLLDFRLPAIETLIEDFHRPFQMAGVANKFLLQFANFGKLTLPRLSRPTFLYLWKITKNNTKQLP